MQRYKIAEFLSPDMVEAVVRIGKDKWEPTILPSMSSKNMPYPRVTRSYNSHEDAWCHYCPLGLYVVVYADAMQYSEFDDDPCDVAIPADGAAFLSYLMSIKYGNPEETSIEDLLKERATELMDAADEFTQDWDAGKIPYDQLGIALGLAG